MRNRTAVTDGTGTYRFDQVDPNHYWIGAESATPGVWLEWSPARVAFQDVRADDLHLKLPQSLFGTVLDAATGEPVGNVRLNFTASDRNPAEFRTDAQGRYRLYVTPRTIRIYSHGTDDRYMPLDGQREVDVAPGQHLELNFRLRAGKPFGGQVLLPDGQPAAGVNVVAQVNWSRFPQHEQQIADALARRDARIRAGQEPPPVVDPPPANPLAFLGGRMGIGQTFRLTTDAQGRFSGFLRRPDLDGGADGDEALEITVTARLPDRTQGEHVRIMTTTVDPSPQDITLRLQPTGTAEFRILNPDGQGIVGASLDAYSDSGIEPHFTELGGGNYRAAGLLQGREYHIFARPPGGNPRKDLRVTANSGQTLVAGPIVMDFWGAQAVPGLIEKASAGDRYAREGAIRNLGEIGPAAAAAVPMLTELLRDDPLNTIRFAAATALGKIGPAAKPAVPDLIRAVQQDRLGVNREAARALGLIGDPAGIPALAVSVHSTELDVARNSAISLGELGRDSPIAVEALIGALTTHRHHLVRAAAADALGKIGPSAMAAVPALLRAAEAMPSFTSRQSAIRALGEIGDPSALPALRAMVEQAAAVGGPGEASIAHTTAEAIKRFHDRSQRPNP